jgi:hypothetical protein
MKMMTLAAIALLACAAPLAQAVEVGQCGSRSEVLKALANEGQRVVVTAHESTKRGQSGVYVVRSKVDKSGYLLRQDRRRGVCVAARLSGVRIGEPGGSARSDRRLVGQNCGHSAMNTRRNGSLCGALQKAGKAVAAIDPDTFVDSRTAQFGFCKVKNQELMLCMESYTKEGL